jgi:hypothetical protein
MGVAADLRDCAQCGTSFVPRREHARFCGVRCRAAWNREHVGEPATGASALLWSLTAMSQTTRRLSRVPTADRHQVLAAIGEAVWWVTLVDATLVRHHPQAYDAVMAAQTPAKRKRVEGTLAGLRFVRNQIGDQTGLGEFIGPRGTGQSAEQAPITGWTWKLVLRPPLASLLPRGRAWEMTRYRAYQAHLAGHCVTEVFGQVTAFLELTAAKATFAIDTAPAAH